MPILICIIIPVIGTIIGSLIVLSIKDTINYKTEKLLLSLASGVMSAASIFSLIIPSINLSYKMGDFAWIPAVVGFGIGIAFLLWVDSVVSKLIITSESDDSLKNKIMLFFAVAIHNIPEGMAVGVLLAGVISGNEFLSFSGALTLSIGIAIQNIPEGAIVSTSLKSKGTSKKKSFIYGVLTGVVEPIGVIIAIVLTKLVTPILPYFLSFAAGAMMYVVVEDLIPESQKGKKSSLSIIGFTLGFILMMVLDIVIG